MRRRVKKLNPLQPRLWGEPRKTTEGSPERVPQNPGGFGIKVTKWGDRTKALRSAVTPACKKFTMESMKPMEERLSCRLF
jgi:hypothetical protein